MSGMMHYLAKRAGSLESIELDFRIVAEEDFDK